MLFLMLLALILFAHIKIAVIQRAFFKLYDRDFKSASLDYVLEPKRLVYEGPDGIRADVRGPEAQPQIDLDPECLSAFHKLTQAQKQQVFATGSSVNDLLINGSFEPFWRACHSANKLESAKYFQDAMLLLSAEKRQIVHAYIKVYTEVKQFKEEAAKESNKSVEAVVKADENVSIEDQSEKIETASEFTVNTAVEETETAEVKDVKKPKKSKTIKNKHVE